MISKKQSVLISTHPFYLHCRSMRQAIKLAKLAPSIIIVHKAWGPSAKKRAVDFVISRLYKRNVTLPLIDMDSFISFQDSLENQSRFFLLKNEKFDIGITFSKNLVFAILVVDKFLIFIIDCTHYISYFISFPTIGYNSVWQKRMTL